MKLHNPGLTLDIIYNFVKIDTQILTSLYMALEWQDNGPREIDTVILNGQGVRDLDELYGTSGLSVREVPADYEDDDQVDFFGVVDDGFGEELDRLADELERDRAYLKGRVVDSSIPDTLSR